MNVYAVIMAGGKGTRFWPRSRESHPKHLLDILSSKSILRETTDRIRPLVPPEQIFVVTGRLHCEKVRHDLDFIPPRNILVEPEGKNTAPCIGLAALHVRKEDPEGVMVVLSADHFIGKEESFLKDISVAWEMAGRGPYLVALGVKPTRPETGYGYLEIGSPVSTIKRKIIYKVKSFHEKPDAEKAREFVKNGRFFWNSGIFVWKASTVLTAIERHLPDLHEGLKEIGRVLGTPKEGDLVKEVYGRLEPISIDHGVMEKSPDVLMLKGAFQWSDVGSWDALWEIRGKDEWGNVFAGEVINVRSRNSFVHSPKKLVAIVDVEDLIVVEDEDALLVCRRGSSQGVKEVVEELEKKDLKRYL